MAQLPIETIRYAAARAVERSSLRAVARQMEMAPSWLDNFIAGKEAVQRAQTLKKLREWFLRNAAALAEVNEPASAAAVQLLVEGLMSQPERSRAREELLEVLARHYGAAGHKPEWLRKLLEPPPSE